MPQELTAEYNMENWREATKNWTFMPFSIEGYGGPSTLYICDTSSQNADQKRDAPFGKHIREAIQIIKGDKD
jgi:hypothetical protein